MISLPDRLYQKGGFRVSLTLLLLLLTMHSPVPAYAGAKAAEQVTDGQAIDLDQDKYRQLFRELIDEYHFSGAELQKIFGGLTINRRILELMETPWEAKPYYEYAPLFLTEKRIATGRHMLAEHRAVLDKIEEGIGVDREIIVAIWGIESRFGKNQGTHNVLRTLNTLFDAYPRRSAFFRKELINFLLLCRENGVEPGSVKGSYAGAFGQTQFISSSFRAYAVSFDGDSKRDVWNSVPDVLASIANYLKKHHWTLGEPLYWELGPELNDPALVTAYRAGWRGRVPWEKVRKTQAPNIPKPADGRELSIVGLELPVDAGPDMRYVAGFPNFQSITHWNHSNRYAMAVVELAEAIAAGKEEHSP